MKNNFHWILLGVAAGILIYMVDNRQKSQVIDGAFVNWMNKYQSKFRKKVLIVNKVDRIEKTQLFSVSKNMNDIINFDETFFISLSRYVR